MGNQTPWVHRKRKFIDCKFWQTLYEKVKVTQSSLTLCNSMNDTVHGLLQTRMLEWVAFPFSSRSSQPRVRTQVFPSLQADSLPAESQEKPKNTGVGSPALLQQIFLTQELNWSFLHCRRILYQLSYQGSPEKNKLPGGWRINNRNDLRAGTL